MTWIREGNLLYGYYSVGYSNINGNGAYRVSLKLVKQTKLKH